MPDRKTRSYPPVGDPTRLDAIMHEGRTLRRRRRLGAAGAGAGGTLAVVLAVAVVLGGPGGGSANPEVVADDPTSTTSTTSTTVAPMPDEMTVTIASGPPATIVVEDPAQPVGATSRQCVTVALYLPAPDDATGAPTSFVGEGTSCAPGASLNGEAVVDITPASVDLGSPQIGCASSLDNPPPAGASSDTATPGRTTFRISAPEVAPGDYSIGVSAVSGLGDGCAPEQSGFEHENIVDVTGSVQLR